MLDRDGKSLFFDEAPISRMRVTREGYLVADVRAARSGIYTYRGSEVGMPDRDVVKVYRSPDIVFDKKTMSSFTSLDVTNDHPDELVDSRNWKKYAVGHTGEDVARDGDFIRVPLIVRDQETIELIQAGKRGLSFGYTCDVDLSPGETPSGEKYDAVQKNLIGNHLAVCGSGRAGGECRIGDDRSTKETGMPDAILRTVLVDGIPVQATDASAQVIDTLQKRVTEASSRNLQQAETHGKEIQARDARISDLERQVADKDKGLGERDAEIKILKDGAADPARINQLVSDRVNVLFKAKALGIKDEEVKDKSNEDVVKIAVQRKMGDAEVNGKSNDYLLACFNLLSRDVGGQAQDSDPLADAVRRSSGLQSTDPVTELERAHRKMVSDMEQAWKNPSPVAH